MSRIDAFSIASQTGSGFPVTTVASHVLVPVETASPGINREVIEVQETLGNRFPTSQDYGTRFFEVSASGAAHYDSFGSIVASFLGASQRTAYTNGGYKHLFDSFANGANLGYKSMYINRADPTTDLLDLYTNALGNTITLSLEPNNVFRYDASWVGTTLDQTQTTAPSTVDASARARFYEATVQIVSAGTATATIPVSSWGISYSNNIDTDNAVLGSTDLAAIQVGNADCEVTFTARDTQLGNNAQEIVDHYRRALTASPVTNRITLTATGALIATSTVSYAVIVDVYNAEYTSAPADVSAADVLKGIDVSARAYGSGSKFVDITVQNGVSTTYS